MGIQVKDIATIIEKALHMDLAKEKSKVLNAIDLAHKDMAEIRDWRKLRMSIAKSLTGSAVSLPTNLIGITGVKSTTERYFKQEEEDVLSVDGRPHWHYAAQTGTNPSATPYFNITDTAGAAATATVTVYYWAYPQTITKDSDEILIPGPRALAMLAIVILLGLMEHQPQDAEPFRIEYKDALSELLERYPVNARAKVPIGRHGQRMATGDLG